MNVVSLAAPDTKTDPLAERYRAAFDKIRGGREQWIEGTLELVIVVRDARAKYPDHREYRRWLDRHNLREISPQNLSAFNKFSEDLAYARQLLEQSTSTSWEIVWRSRPRNRTLSKSRRGAIQTGSGPTRTGSGQRKRAAVIPTCMRDDYVPGSVPRSSEPKPRRRRRGVASAPPYERPVPRLKGLTPEQVDPDFVGTPAEFTRKYGLVNLHTKEQIEYHKCQDELTAWLSALSDLERTAQAFVKAKAPDSNTLHQWLNKPGKAEKFAPRLALIESAWLTIAPCLKLIRNKPRQ